jgi:hypothetical protein
MKKILFVVLVLVSLNACCSMGSCPLNLDEVYYAPYQACPNTESEF